MKSSDRSRFLLWVGITVVLTSAIAFGESFALQGQTGPPRNAGSRQTAPVITPTPP
jgi:hypothetical protein